MTYSTIGFPCFALDYVGRKGAKLTREGSTWTLAGSRNEVSRHARTACEARLLITSLISRLDGKQDKRRRALT